MTFNKKISVAVLVTLLSLLAWGAGHAGTTSTLQAVPAVYSHYITNDWVQVNELGKKGWELVAVIEHPVITPGEQSRKSFYLKKRER